MPKHSAGILLYRKSAGGYEALIVHPGGPFWARKDLGAWSVPKGEFDAGEDLLAAAKREFAEEIGAPAPDGEYQFVGEFKVTSGKVIHVYALESDFNLEQFQSNMFEMEWPPKSGLRQEFPEVDKAAWTPLALARGKVVKGQVAVIDALAARLGQTLDASDMQPQTGLF
jgi:predicted NUDIX family NTP pyrophosphohydrolase